MVQAVERCGLPWTFVDGGRSRASMAFTAELSRFRKGSLRIVPQDEMGHPEFDVLLRTLDKDTLIYACGPVGMLRAIKESAELHGVLSRLRFERFSAPADVSLPLNVATDGAFDVVLQRSGRTVHVPAGRTLASVLQDAGADVSFSCEEGSCGTCETRVISGFPEHRDCILSRDERAKNDRMMVCVGRALSATLVLDA